MPVVRMSEIMAALQDELAERITPFELAMFLEDERMPEEESEVQDE